MTVGGDGFVTGEGATFDVTGTQTEVGNSANTFTYTLNANTKAGNYNITKVEGTLTVTGSETPLVIKSNSKTWKYDGAEHTFPSYTVTYNGAAVAHIPADSTVFELPTHDTLRITATASLTHYSAGVANTFTYAIDHQSFYTGITTTPGTIAISKRDVTLTSATDSKTYDGAALTNSTVTVGGDSFAAGEGASYDVTGSQLNAATSANTFTYVLNSNTQAGDYNVTTANGTLTVNAVTDLVTVTITGHTGTAVYDGTAHTTTGYDFAADNSLYTESCVSFGSTASASRTDVDTTFMGLTAGMFSNNSANFANVTFNVTDGYQAITPITTPITITAASDSKVYDGTALTNSAYTYTTGVLLTGDVLTATVEGTQTNAGSSANTVMSWQVKRGTTDVTANYTITAVNGTLTVNRVSVTVTADNKTMAVGETAPALTATVAGLQGSDNESLITYALSRQPGDTIGTYVITASGDAVQGNYNVTYYPGTFTIVEPTKIVTITSGSKNWTYDGTAHSWPEYTVTCEGASVTHIDGDATKFRMPTGDTLHITPTASVTHVGPAVANTFSYQFTPTTSIYTYETATNNGNLSINKKPLSITGTFSKEYDGSPLTVSYNELNYNGGLVGGDELTAGTITTDGFQAGTYHCGAGNTWSYATLEEGTATASGFAPTSVTQDYAVNFNLTLTITARTLALTAGSGEKVYDGTELTNNSYDVTSTLGSGDAVSATVNGSQTCVGESANVIATASVQVMHDNGDGTFTDVTASYSPVNCTNGTLKVTPITTGFACPGDLTITLPEGVSQITITEADLNGPATLTPAVAGTHVGHNLISTTLGAGTHTVTWTLYDNCNNAMTTCDQTITVKYPECDGTMTYLGHTYAYKRIGSQCWFTENLRAEIGSDYHTYNDDPTMLDKFGYLYTWYTAVGVTEGDNDAVPDDHFVADDGTHYVQGICPAGWAIPSQADVEVLNLSGFDADMLKDPSTEYWLPGYQGTGESGFKARAGGRYNATQSRYEDLMTGFHFWQSEAPTGSVSLVSACIAYYCGSVLTATPNIKTDRKSVRCLRKVAP